MSRGILNRRVAGAVSTVATSRALRVRTFADRELRRAAPVLTLAIVLGSALFVRFGFERSAGPHLVEARASAADVSVRLYRSGGEEVPSSELAADGWSQTADGSWVSERPGALLRSLGPTGSTLEARWALVPGSDGELLVDGVVRDRRSAAATGTNEQASRVMVPLTLRPMWWLLWTTLIAWSAPAAYLFVRAWRAAGMTHARTTRALVLLGLLAVGAALRVIWPIADPAVVPLDLEVVNVSQGGPAEVLVALRDAADRPVVEPEELAGTGWEVRGPWALSTERGDSLHWRGSVRPSDDLVFATSPSSGTIDVRVNGQVNRVDLATPLEGQRTALTLDSLGGQPDSATTLLLWTARLADVVLLAGLMVLVPAVLLVRNARRMSLSSTPAHVEPGWADTIRFGAIPAIGWTGLVVLLWPGVMVTDSLNQWGQLRASALSDWHPYLLAVYFGLLRHIVDAPWLPLLVLVMIASLLIGRIAARSAVEHAPWVGWAQAWGVVVALPVALMTVTLWKDSFYGVALLALTCVVWRMGATGGDWARSRSRLAGAVAACAAICLTRHNGWPIVAVTIVALIVAYAGVRRRLVIAGLATLGLVAAANGPLAHAMDVEPSPIESLVYVQHIAMHLHAGTEVTADERAFLDEIRPTEPPWPYLCFSINPTFVGPDGIPTQDYDDKRAHLRSLALRLAWRNPRAELHHLWCSSKLVWQPTDQDTGTYFLSWYVENDRLHYIPSYAGQPAEDPPAPRLARAVHAAIDVLPIWLVRPALYLYALVAAAIFAAIRSRRVTPLIVTLPALVHSAVLGLISVSQDVRYQYGVMLVAVVFVPLLLTAPKRGTTPALDPHSDRRYVRRRVGRADDAVSGPRRAVVPRRPSASAAGPSQPDQAVEPGTDPMAPPVEQPISEH